PSSPRARQSMASFGMDAFARFFIKPPPSAKEPPHVIEGNRPHLEDGVIDGRNRLCKILPNPPFPKEGVIRSSPFAKGGSRGIFFDRFELFLRSNRRVRGNLRYFILNRG